MPISDDAKDAAVREVIFGVIKGSLKYANFTDADVRKQMIKLVDSVEADCEEGYYSPTSRSEKLSLALQEYLDELETADARVDDDETKEVVIGKSESLHGIDDEDDDDDEKRIPRVVDEPEDDDGE